MAGYWYLILDDSMSQERLVTTCDNHVTGPPMHAYAYVYIYIHIIYIHIH